MADSFNIGGKEAREARLRKAVMENELVSDRTYNLIMGGVVAYGLLVNAIICAVVGNTFRYVNPILFLIVYFVCCVAGSMIARRSDSPAISFLGYNMVVVPVGLVVSSLVYAYGGISSSIVLYAFADTFAITVLMICGALLYPQFFSKLGGVLGIALIALLIVSVVSIFIGGSSIILSVIAAGIFSLYIGYDFWRSQQFAKTVDNAVDCALDIYLDIINLFIRLLEIFGKSRRRR